MPETNAKPSGGIIDEVGPPLSILNLLANERTPGVMNLSTASLKLPSYLSPPAPTVALIKPEELANLGSKSLSLAEITLDDGPRFGVI